MKYISSRGNESGLTFEQVLFSGKYTSSQFPLSSQVQVVVINDTVTGF